jgi:hypothetical protein
MLIEVSKQEGEALQYACVMNDLSCLVMQTPITGIVKVRIRDRGREISPALSYRLKGVAEQKMRYDRERILEADLLQEPNNVLVLVENIEDLPR